MHHSEYDQLFDKIKQLLAESRPEGALAVGQLAQAKATLAVADELSRIYFLLESFTDSEGRLSIHVSN